MIIDENGINVLFLLQKSSMLSQISKKICDLVNYVSNLCYVCGDKIL